MTSSGRLRDAIAVLDIWIRDHPSDTAIALDLARLRARSGDWRGSIAQYTALIRQHRTAELLLERGQTYLWSGDAGRGETDLLASDSLQPRAETRRQLGDHYRWQGDLARSASWYRLALADAPNDTLVRQSMRLLDRAIDARLLLPGELGPGEAGSGVRVITDNAGFDLYTLRLSQALALPMGSSSVLTLAGELRSAARTSAAGSAGHLDGYGFDVAVASRVGTSKVSATLGLLEHGDVAGVLHGSASVDGFVGGARLRTTIRRAPAYELLWAPRLLGLSLTGDDEPITAVQGQSTVTLPLGQRVEVWAMGEYVSVSDHNARSAFQYAVRRRLAGLLSLSYSGGWMAYDMRTALYYSPGRYVSQSLGAEFSRYREEGLSFALRLAPGYAWMREPAGTLDPVEQDVSAFQLTGGLELGYRSGRWDLLLSTGLGAGREGGYRSGNAMLYLRRSW